MICSVSFYMLIKLFRITKDMISPEMSGDHGAFTILSRLSSRISEHVSAKDFDPESWTWNLTVKSEHQKPKRWNLNRAT